MNTASHTISSDFDPLHAAADRSAAQHGHHFPTLEQQAHAAKIGMWAFLVSEVLLFSGLFALYAAYRAAYPHAFALGIEHNNATLGTLNTAILLVSSYFVATALHYLRSAEPRKAAARIVVAIALGLTFIGIKSYEYYEHFHDGIYPGVVGALHAAHPPTAPLSSGEPLAAQLSSAQPPTAQPSPGAPVVAGLPVFFTLYFFTTGLHALHVFGGMTILAIFAILLWRRHPIAAPPHRYELAALYWHLVDAIWVFLWPMYYLMHSAS